MTKTFTPSRRAAMLGGGAALAAISALPGRRAAAAGPSAEYRAWRAAWQRYHGACNDDDEHSDELIYALCDDAWGALSALTARAEDLERPTVQDIHELASAVQVTEGEAPFVVQALIDTVFRMGGANV